MGATNVWGAVADAMLLFNVGKLGGLWAEGAEGGVGGRFGNVARGGSTFAPAAGIAVKIKIAAKLSQGLIRTKQIRTSKTRSIQATARISLAPSKFLDWKLEILDSNR